MKQLTTQVLFAIFFVFILNGCQNPTDTNAPQTYFNLKGFIETQIKDLEKRKPLVSKQMTLGNATDSKTTTDINWAKELELFIQTDLNKEAYKVSYDISKPAANTYFYILKKGEKLPVKSLKIVIDEKFNQPNLIEATIQEENQLYSSEKSLTLTCTMRPEGVWLIKTYSISGLQYLTLSDKKIFSVTGMVK